MNGYHVEFSGHANKTLRRMDPGVRNMVIKWIRKNLEGTTNPCTHGRALAGNLSGLWRYRVGSYRLIAEIHDDRLVILLLEVGHRSWICL